MNFDQRLVREIHGQHDALEEQRHRRPPLVVHEARHRDLEAQRSHFGHRFSLIIIGDGKFLLHRYILVVLLLDRDLSRFLLFLGELAAHERREDR